MRAGGFRKPNYAAAGDLAQALPADRVGLASRTGYAASAAALHGAPDAASEALCAVLTRVFLPGFPWLR